MERLFQAAALTLVAFVALTPAIASAETVAMNDAVTVAEDSATTTIDVRSNDTEPGTIVSKTDGAHGAVTITTGGTAVTYTPGRDYCGADSFTYTLNGGSTATVSVTVTCIEDDPQAVDDASTSVEDGPAKTIDVLANDTDVDGGTKTVTSVTQGVGGSVTTNGSVVTYKPSRDFCGDDTFTYALQGGSDAFVDVAVACVDDPPSAVSDSRTVSEDSDAAAIDVAQNDTDVDEGPTTVDSVTKPSHGVVVLTDDGVAYSPARDYCGSDQFTYKLNGGSTAPVKIKVRCVAPQTTLRRGKRTVTTRHKRAKVRFRFTSSDRDSSFACKLDRRRFRPCTSGRVYRVKPGRHTFRVRATDAFGKTDATPAKRKFRVVRSR